MTEEIPKAKIKELTGDLFDLTKRYSTSFTSEHMLAMYAAWCGYIIKNYIELEHGKLIVQEALEKSLKET